LLRFAFRAPAAIFLLALLLPIAAACSSSDDGDGRTIVLDPGNRPRYQGVLVQPTLQKPDIPLVDTAGQPFDLRAETDGYLTLLFVGYTHCPDICPMHMHDIAQALKQLPADVTERIRVVFVTADPERDTPEALRKWLDLFNPEFIGLTGEREQTDAFQRALHIEPATRTDLGGGRYAVNHAAYVMAFTNDNLAHIVYPFGVDLDVWLHDLPLLAREGWKGS
jgi:protein SCO1/2